MKLLDKRNAAFGVTSTHASSSSWTSPAVQNERPLPSSGRDATLSVDVDVGTAATTPLSTGNLIRNAASDRRARVDIHNACPRSCHGPHAAQYDSTAGPAAIACGKRDVRLRACNTRTRGVLAIHTDLAMFACRRDRMIAHAITREPHRQGLRREWRRNRGTQPRQAKFGRPSCSSYNRSHKDVTPPVVQGATTSSKSAFTRLTSTVFITCTVCAWCSLRIVGPPPRSSLLRRLSKVLDAAQ